MHLHITLTTPSLADTRASLESKLTVAATQADADRVQLGVLQQQHASVAAELAQLQQHNATFDYQVRVSVCIKHLHT
jgi:hypothetical protein